MNIVSVVNSEAPLWEMTFLLMERAKHQNDFDSSCLLENIVECFNSSENFHRFVLDL